MTPTAALCAQHDSLIMFEREMAFKTTETRYAADPRLSPAYSMGEGAGDSVAELAQDFRLDTSAIEEAIRCEAA